VIPQNRGNSNGNNPRWINLSMEIVALYVPVLTGKNEDYLSALRGEMVLRRSLSLFTQNTYTIIDDKPELS